MGESQLFVGVGDIVIAAMIPGVFAVLISQDEIDNLLREHPDRHDYRIGVYNFFQEHSDRKEREKYLSHLPDRQKNV